MAVAVEIDACSVTLDDLPSVIAAYEQAGAELALAVARLDRDAAWGSDGAAVSMTAWMRTHCRMSNTDASRLLRHGRFLTKFGTIATAAVDGTLAGGHVAAIRQAVTPDTEPVLAEQQDAVVAAIAPLPVADALIACRHWKARAEAIVDSTEPRPPHRDLTYATTGDGAVVGRFELDGPTGVEFTRAIDNALTWKANDDFRLPGYQRADALFEICAFYNANHHGDGTPRHRPHIELTMSLEQVAGLCNADTIDRDAVITTAATEAFLCDSVLHRVVHAGSAVVDYGRSSRSVPINLFRLVAARDRGCRYPGCDRKVAWCEAHHVQHWRHGGNTAPDNLVLLCSRHHHQIHQPGWHTKLLPDGEFQVTTPTALVHTSRPPERLQI